MATGYGSEFAPWSRWGKGLIICSRNDGDIPATAVPYLSASASDLPEYNTNRVVYRDPTDLDGEGLLSPMMDGGGVLHIHDSEPPSPTPSFPHLIDTQTDRTFCETGLYAVAGFASDWDSRESYWRSSGQCVWLNTSGTPITSAIRIPHGSGGCMDCVPGVYGIVFVPDSIVPGVSAQIYLVHGKSWYRAWKEDTYLQKSSAFANYDLAHPYIDPSEAITVDLSDGNSNIHVIPGVAIEFNGTPDEGSAATVAVGWEYVNAKVISDVTKSFGGPALVPLASFAPVDGGTVRAFRGDGDRFGPVPDFAAFNISGALLTGCKMKLMAFCRMDQGRAVSPFLSWYQGGGKEPTASADTYTVEFRNVRPGAADLFCSGSIDTDIYEVEESTYELGTVHYDGEGLALDGSTLYHWPAFGAFFKLATDVVDYDGATVTVHDSKLLFTDSSHFSAKSIGRWGKTIGSLTANGYYATGALQTQGYEVDFVCSALDATRGEWYNWFDAVTFKTFSALGSAIISGKRYYTGLQLYCDDPKYFCFIPLTFYCMDADSSVEQINHRVKTGDKTQASVVFGVRTGQPDFSLLLRAQSIPAAMKAILDRLGVTKS